jgi:hypothetical protein
MPGAEAPAQTPEAPSFTAVFAQIAEQAAAAGTTVASIAGSAQPASQPVVTTMAPTTGTPTANVTTPSTAAAPPADADSGPAGPLFGANPWLNDPTGANPDGSVTHYNPVYFATQQTAQTVAGMLGGQVVQSIQITNAPGSPFMQNQPNLMVQLANGGLVNPGFIADLYTHGWNQDFINQQISAEVADATRSVNA